MVEVSPHSPAQPFPGVVEEEEDAPVEEATLFPVHQPASVCFLFLEWQRWQALARLHLCPEAGESIDKPPHRPALLQARRSQHVTESKCSTPDYTLSPKRQETKFI